MSNARIVGPGEGVALKAGPNQVTLKASSDDSQRLSLIELRAAPRFVAPAALHHHTREDWIAYVTEGEPTFVFADREVRASKGATVFVPAGEDFVWRNETDEPAVYLAIHAPAGFDQFFVDVAEGVEAQGGAAKPDVMREGIPPSGPGTAFGEREPIVKRPGGLGLTAAMRSRSPDFRPDAGPETHDSVLDPFHLLQDRETPQGTRDRSHGHPTARSPRRLRSPAAPLQWVGTRLQDSGGSRASRYRIIPSRVAISS